MFLRLTPLALIAALALAGCSSLSPMSFKSESPATIPSAAAAADASANWNDVPVLTEGKSAVVLITPQSLPTAVAQRRLSMELEPGATVQDVVAVLGKLGIPVILADEEAAAKKFFLPRYRGTLGNLLSTVSRATNVWFTWQDGAIVVSPTERIAVSLPQEAGFAKQLGEGLDSLGIKERAVSWHAGMATLEVTPAQFVKARTFLERMTANAAVINLQVAVVNVALNQTAKQGVDWDKLSLSVLRGGSMDDLRNWQNAAAVAEGGMGSGFNNGYNNGYNNNGTVNNGSTNNGTPGTGGTTNGTTPTDTSKLGGVSALSIAAGALQGAVFRQNFSFTGLFNFLQTYGTTETKQNVLLKTVGGNKVEFKSLTQIPYVSEIGATTTGNTNGSVVGSTQTEKADDGITVEMTPMFDSANNTVTVDLKLSIKAVVAFNELSAGNQLGKLTQPTTAERSFTDSLRLRPGQTVVVGGLTYDSVTDNRGSPVFLAGTRMESESLKVQRQTMFIVLRPTVTKMGQLLQDQVGEAPLELLPAAAGKELAEAEAEEAAKSAKGSKARKVKGS